MKNLGNIIQVTIAEAVTIMMNVVGHPFTYWATFTEPTLTGGKKTLALFEGAVYKYATYNLVDNRKYDRAIEIACEKLGIDFSNWKPQDHNYAEHIGGNIMSHKADAHIEDIMQRRLYAQFMLHKGCQIECQYFDANLKPIAFETIKPYLRDNTSKKQADLGLSAEEQIPCINFGMGSIKQFTIDKQKYEIVAE